MNSSQKSEGQKSEGKAAAEDEHMTFESKD
jgi:hypothetical protein